MNSKLSDNKKELLFSELHSLLSSGLDFNRSFEMLVCSEKGNKNYNLLNNLYLSIVKGNQLCTAMKNSGAFSSIDYGIVKVGEETGRLDEILLFLSDHYRKIEERNKMLKSAVSYPIIIFITALLVITFMILVIVPMFEQVYMRMGGELPAITQSVIHLSKKFPLILTASTIIIVIVGAWLFTTGETPNTQKIIYKLLLAVPYIGDIQRKNAIVIICKFLSLMLASGIPLMNGIALLEDIVKSYPHKVSFRQIVHDLSAGKSFSSALSAFPRLYNKKFVTLVGVGEETNRMSTILKKFGDELSIELEYKLKFLGNIIEPVLILLVGALVALILVSMYLPMFKLSGIMA
jgi:type IV pilus assembly protein PilC